jgi:hypothetical protein
MEQSPLENLIVAKIFNKSILLHKMHTYSSFINHPAFFKCIGFNTGSSKLKYVKFIRREFVYPISQNPPLIPLMRENVSTPQPRQLNFNIQFKMYPSIYAYVLKCPLFVRFSYKIFVYNSLLLCSCMPCAEYAISVASCSDTDVDLYVDIRKSLLRIF